jgi:hypothetical protein
MWGGGVTPLIGERAKSCTSLRDCIEDVQQVLSRAGEPIQPRDQQDIPGPKAAIAFANAFLSVTAPLIFSAKTRSAPAAVSVACCASIVCPSVDTLA